MKINECMSRDVCFVNPNCNVFDAARIMNENHIGCIPVCDDKKNVVGVITDRDIVLRTVAYNKDAKQTQVSEVMTTNVYTCKCEQEIREAQDIMEKNQIRRIPIVDSDLKMVGILTTGDLIKNSNLKEENVTNTMQSICNDKGNIKNCC